MFRFFAAVGWSGTRTELGFRHPMAGNFFSWLRMPINVDEFMPNNSESHSQTVDLAY